MTRKVPRYSMPKCQPVLKPASYKLVASRVMVYSSVHVDQRQVRAVHNCFLGCPFSPEFGRDCETQTKDPLPQKERIQDRVLSESPFICRAIHYGFCTVVALPPGVVSRGDEDIEEKRKSSELLPTWRRDEPKAEQRNYPDLALKSEPAKAEVKVVNFPEVTLSNNLPDLVTCNDLSEVDRKKSVSANDLANNNVVHIDAPRKLVNISESTRAKADLHHTQDLAQAKPKLFQEQREANKRQKSQQIVNVPQFYFPYGKPVASEENEAILKRLTEVFKSLPDQKAGKEDMDKITQACRCPKYWRVPLYNAAGGETTECVSAQAFMAMWRRITKQCHDDASRFFRLLARPGANHLTTEDLNPLVQDIVDSHPGLIFLQDAPEFHSRYITTVVSRIFYTINRSWTGRITLPELRRSNLLSVIALLEEEDDINQIMDYFSYEHFYVIYCKFWELDSDHDLYIDKKDLARHQDHAISSRMIDRIFSPGTVLRQNMMVVDVNLMGGEDVDPVLMDIKGTLNSQTLVNAIYVLFHSPVHNSGKRTCSASIREGRMSYNEFVCFLLSEEDKKQPISVEYWFRCMDLDGDGLLSMFELEFFYEEQLNKMESLGIETLPFEDCLCQLLDLVKPKNPDYITLHDLKNCKLAYIFFDTLFNLEKFLEHEQRDPFASNRDYDSESPEPTDWEKYAADEYEMLVAEEGGQDTQQHSLQGDDCDYADDFEPEEEDIITIDLRQKATISEPGLEPQRNQWIGEGGDDSSKGL